MVSGVRVLADGSDDEFLGVDDDAQNQHVEIDGPNDFLGSLKRRPESLRPHRAFPSEQDEPVERGPAGKRDPRLGLVQRSALFDPTSAEVYSRLIYQPPSPRQAERETLEDVAQFMRDGQWSGLDSCLTTGHPELYGSLWYIDAQGYARVWMPSATANLDITAQARAMVEKGLDKIPSPTNPAQRRAMENVYALLGREFAEPISRADRQSQLRAAVRDNPDLSVRELARREGVSKSKIHRIRKTT
jgi:hypothetical protein